MGKVKLAGRAVGMAWLVSGGMTLGMLGLTGCAQTARDEPAGGPSIGAAAKGKAGLSSAPAAVPVIPLARAVPISSATFDDGTRTWVLVKMRGVPDGSEVFRVREASAPPFKVSVDPTEVSVEPGARQYRFEVRGLEGQSGTVDLELFEASQSDQIRFHKMTVPQPRPNQPRLPRETGQGAPGLSPAERVVPISRIDVITPPNSATRGAYAPGTLLNFRATINTDARDRLPADRLMVVVFCGGRDQPEKFIAHRDAWVLVDDATASSASFHVQLAAGGTERLGKFTVAVVDGTGTITAETDVTVDRAGRAP
jgi:hypothetical protein